MWSPPQGFVANSLIASKLWYNVKDYGPAGDGVTDSTTAINAAIAASPDNAVIYFPRGTYNITSSLTPGVSDGHILMGDRGDLGSPPILKWTGASGGGPMVLFDRSLGNCDSSAIVGIKFDGNNLANVCAHLKVDTGSSIQGPMLSDVCFGGYRTRGLVLGIDDTSVGHAGQIASLYGHAVRFIGSTSGVNTSIGMLVNAQNLEWGHFDGLRFDPPNGSEHAYHIFNRSGALQINSLVTTRSVTYAIYTKDQVVVNGWRAEESLIFEADSTDPLAPNSINNLQHRWAGAVGDSILYRVTSATSPLVINGAHMGGNITFGPTDPHTFMLNEVEFVQGAVAFQGPTKASSGTWTSAGKTVYYINGIGTVGFNNPYIFGSTLQKSETAADTNVLTYTPPTTAGSYRLHFTINVSAATAATLGWTATWKDSNGTAQAPTNLDLIKNGVAAPALTFLAAAGDTYVGDTSIDIDNSATAIVCKLTFTGTSFTAKVSAFIEQLA